jgi:hypothetical protein
MERERRGGMAAIGGEAMGEPMYEVPLSAVGGRAK